MLAACSPAPSSTVVEVPPTELPTAPQPTVGGTLQQTRAPTLAECEAPRTLDGCNEIARVRAGDLELSSPTCYVDARVHAGETGRVLQCPSGTVIAFRGATFAGTYDSRSVNVCMKTQFPFSDGCTWQTVQRIRGGDGAFEFTYAERPISGGSCASSSCTARADIQLVR